MERGKKRQKGLVFPFKAIGFRRMKAVGKQLELLLGADMKCRFAPE